MAIEESKQVEEEDVMVADSQAHYYYYCDAAALLLLRGTGGGRSVLLAVGVEELLLLPPRRRRRQGEEGGGDSLSATIDANPTINQSWRYRRNNSSRGALAKRNTVCIVRTDWWEEAALVLYCSGDDGDGIRTSYRAQSGRVCVASWSLN